MAGKSHLVTNLLQLHSAPRKPALRAPKELMASTTDGMSIYRSRAMWNEGLPLVAALDFEGENGTVPKVRGSEIFITHQKLSFLVRQTLLDRFTPSFLQGHHKNVTDIQTINQLRAAAVKKFLPTIAMLLGDVVMVVTALPFTDSSTRDRVFELAQQVLESVDDAPKPALAIVFNKAELR